MINFCIAMGLKNENDLAFCVMSYVRARRRIMNESDLLRAIACPYLSGETKWMLVRISTTPPNKKNDFSCIFRKLSGGSNEHLLRLAIDFHRGSFYVIPSAVMDLLIVLFRQAFYHGETFVLEMMTPYIRLFGNCDKFWDMFGELLRQELSREVRGDVLRRIMHLIRAETIPDSKKKFIMVRKVSRACLSQILDVRLGGRYQMQHVFVRYMNALSQNYPYIRVDSRVVQSFMDICTELPRGGEERKNAVQSLKHLMQWLPNNVKGQLKGLYNDAADAGEDIISAVHCSSE